MRFFTILLILIIGWHSSYSESATLTGISIKACSRGLALVLETDEPVVESFQDILQGSILKIKLKNVVYGLNESSFLSFPAYSPVKKIVALEETDRSIIIETTFRNKIGNEIKSKRINNRNMFLVSSAAFPEFDWKVSSGKTAVKKSVMPNGSIAKNKRRAFIKTIRLIKRGQIEEFVITTDSPVRIKAKRKNGMIIAVFENAKNGLPKSSYVLPDNLAFKTLTLKESSRNGIDIVGVLITNASYSIKSSIIQIKPRRFTIFTILEDSFSETGLSYWSTDERKNFSYEFIKASIPRNLSNAPDHLLDQKLKTQPARLVVIRNKVNFRSKPSTDSPDNIIDCLRMGNIGTSLRQQGRWHYMRMDEGGTEGWIYGNMVADSAHVSKEQWKAITASQAKRGDIQSEINDIPGVSESTEKRLTSVTYVKSSEMPKLAYEQQSSNAKKVTKYRIYGRDPYLPLDECEFLKSDLPDVENCMLVGILFDEIDCVALLEHGSKGGEAFALRENSAVLNGRVLKIRRNRVVFLLNEGGFSRKFVLKFKSKKE